MSMIKTLFLSYKFVAISMLLLFSIKLSNAANYYVAKNHASANDSNPGTLNSPWKTIQHAAETIQPGDTVFIRTGSYYEQVYTTHNGNAANGYIVFAAFPGEKPVIDGTDVATGRTGFGISHSYIKLIGLEIRNWETGIWMEIGGNIELADCEVHHCVFGIGAANGCHNFVLDRVEMHHFDLYGFDASPSGGADCYNGTLNDCIAYTARDRQQNVDGFALGHGTQHDFVLNRCQAYDVYDGFDISARNTTLYRCLAYDCMNGTYKLWQHQVRLINCIGYNSAVANVEIDWDEKAGRTTLINCTFFDAKVFTIWIENSADTLHLYNCILAGGDNIGLTFEQMEVKNYHGDFNIFHNDNPNRVIAVGYHDEFTLDQVAAGSWTSYSGQDAHSHSVSSAESLFVNSATSDLHLTKTSAAIDRATANDAPLEDFDGNPRPSGNGFDIGAFECQFPVKVKENKETFSVSKSFLMCQNYPNPFNSKTMISYRIDAPGFVAVEILNIHGQSIKQWEKNFQSVGLHHLVWDARDDFGNQVPSGAYLCRVTYRDLSDAIKLLYLK